MPSSKTTRLRSIRAKSLDDIEQALDLLGFKVEIKSGPLPVKAGDWVISFVIPDEQDWESRDLRKL